MVRYTDKNGKEYILRFDMNAMEMMKEKFDGGYVEGINKMQSRDADVVRDVFVILAQAGEDYIAEEVEHRNPGKVSGEGLISRHSSIGRIRGMMSACEEAIKDGNRMQTRDDEDSEIRDGYLDELKKQEAEKN